eukprot:152129-Chlamydomonas_euryale.AAC.5
MSAGGGALSGRGGARRMNAGGGGAEWRKWRKMHERQRRRLERPRRRKTHERRRRWSHAPEQPRRQPEIREAAGWGCCMRVLKRYRAPMLTYCCCPTVLYLNGRPSRAAKVLNQ